ncbi:MAG: phosphopantothenoylcysteine synthase [Methylacidiphilales bacterium]|nr:phosphopantothenoylcysteine synthase [Candidatus Methylacidiphilales bacterium]MDW8349500.1 flavoprotein [Verrucomicrobiae bacterium]
MSRIVLGITGSIAAFRAAEIASALTKQGHAVQAVFSQQATRFISPLSLASLTRNPAYTDEAEWELRPIPLHIEIADWADLIVVAPATAHLIAQYAHGFASDLLTSILLATQAPTLLAPAMNGKMWLHPATQQNVELLRTRGVRFIGPDEGLLACGYEGIGRLWPVEGILRSIEDILASG